VAQRMQIISAYANSPLLEEHRCVSSVNSVPAVANRFAPSAVQSSSLLFVVLYLKVAATELAARPSAQERKSDHDRANGRSRAFAAGRRDAQLHRTAADAALCARGRRPAWRVASRTRQRHAQYPNLTAAGAPAATAGHGLRRTQDPGDRRA